MRAQSEMEMRIFRIVEPQAKALGLEIVRIRVSGQRRPTLQIMAERSDGAMDVEDCAKLSRRLSPVLDAEDPIAGEYSLEVSSPGIDRPLTREGDFGKWTGHEARIEVDAPVDGRRRFHGFIEGEARGVVLIKLKDGGEAQIPVAEMTKAHLVLTDRLIKAAQASGQAREIDEGDEGFDKILVADKELRTLADVTPEDEDD